MTKSNVPLSWPILKALQMCQCDTKHIAQCIMSRAIPEATGRCNQATTCTHIAPAATRATANKTTMNKCTHFAGHFDGRDGAPVRYCMHCPIKEV
jgi:hypothetical protein